MCELAPSRVRKGSRLILRRFRLEKDGPPVYSEAPFSLARALGLHAGARQRQQLITMSLRDPSSLEYTNSVDTALSAKTTSGFVKVRLRSVAESLGTS